MVECQTGPAGHAQREPCSFRGIVGTLDGTKGSTRIHAHVIRPVSGNALTRIFRDVHLQLVYLIGVKDKAGFLIEFSATAILDRFMRVGKSTGKAPIPGKGPTLATHQEHMVCATDGRLTDGVDDHGGHRDRRLRVVTGLVVGKFPVFIGPMGYRIVLMVQAMPEDVPENLRRNRRALVHGVHEHVTTDSGGRHVGHIHEDGLDVATVAEFRMEVEVAPAVEHADAVLVNKFLGILPLAGQQGFELVHADNEVNVRVLLIMPSDIGPIDRFKGIERAGRLLVDIKFRKTGNQHAVSVLERGLELLLVILGQIDMYFRVVFQEILDDGLVGHGKRVKCTAIDCDSLFHIYHSLIPNGRHSSNPT